MTYDDRKICKGTYHDAVRQYNACDARHYCILYKAYIKQLADNDSDYPDILERQMPDYTGGDKPCFIEVVEKKSERIVFGPYSLDELEEIMHEEMRFVHADTKAEFAMPDKKAIWGW